MGHDMPYKVNNTQLRRKAELEYMLPFSQPTLASPCWDQESDSELGVRGATSELPGVSFAGSGQPPEWGFGFS